MIEFRNVTKTYPNGTQAIKNLNLTIPDGQLLVLLGSSGCGKTTLLRMINRLVEPTSGSVLVDGQDVANSDPIALRRSIGYVLQGGGLLPHMTVLANIALVPKLAGASKREAHEKALELLDTVGLDRSLASRYPAQLSGGQRQRVGVARALAANARILLMDEPFSALDPVIRKELQDEILRLHGQGEDAFGHKRTVIFVTHDINEALRLADRIVLLSPGGVIEQDSKPWDLVEHPANDFVRQFVEAGRPELRNGQHSVEAGE
jgi:osmoprotectant transport system ATP-binding protein